MAKDESNMGGPTKSPRDEPEGHRDKAPDENVQSQSGAEGDNERQNREKAEKGRRSGSQSNPS